MPQKIHDIVAAAMGTVVYDHLWASRPMADLQFMARKGSFESRTSRLTQKSHQIHRAKELLAVLNGNRLVYPNPAAKVI